MALKAASNAPSSNKARFDWSLGPIITFMKVLGIQLVAEQNYIVRLLFLIFGSAVLLSNILINGLSFVSNVLRDLSKDQAAASLLNTIVGHFAHVFFVMGSHIAFSIFLIASRRWRDLWVALRNIQNTMKLSEQFFVQCRKHCYFAVFLLILVRINFLNSKILLNFYLHFLSLISA